MPQVFDREVVIADVLVAGIARFHVREEQLGVAGAEVLAAAVVGTELQTGQDRQHRGRGHRPQRRRRRPPAAPEHRERRRDREAAEEGRRQRIGREDPQQEGLLQVVGPGHVQQQGRRRQAPQQRGQLPAAAELGEAEDPRHHQRPEGVAQLAGELVEQGADVLEVRGGAHLIAADAVARTPDVVPKAVRQGDVAVEQEGRRAHPQQMEVRREAQRQRASAGRQQPRRAQVRQQAPPARAQQQQHRRIGQHEQRPVDRQAQARDQRQRRQQARPVPVGVALREDAAERGEQQVERVDLGDLRLVDHDRRQADDGGGRHARSDPGPQHPVGENGEQRAGQRRAQGAVEPGPQGGVAAQQDRQAREGIAAEDVGRVAGLVRQAQRIAGAGEQRGVLEGDVPRHGGRVEGEQPRRQRQVRPAAFPIQLHRFCRLRRFYKELDLASGLIRDLAEPFAAPSLKIVFA